MTDMIPTDPLDRCNISACNRAGQCVFQPCRAPAPMPEHPMAGIGALFVAIVIMLSGYLWL